MKQSIDIFYKALEFLLASLKKENELCLDQRIKWLKDLYLNLFYDNANKRFQPPTPMQALLAFGGRQFNFGTLENNFYSSINNLIVTCQTSQQTGLKSGSNQTHTDSSASCGMLPGDEATANPHIRIQRPNNMENTTGCSSIIFVLIQINLNSSNLTVIPSESKNLIKFY